MNMLMRSFVGALMLASSAMSFADDVSVVKLAITPAGRPQPAMRYRLYPAARELQDGNAAGLYYRALLALHRGEITSEVHERFNELLEVAPDKLPLAEAKQVLTRFSTALDEVSLATKRARAIWDIPLRERGVSTLLPEVQDARMLARILKLQVRVFALEGKHEQAVESLEQMFVLARHIGESGTLISGLVGVAITGIAADEIQRLACLPNSPNLYWALTALPEPLVNMRVAIESEQLLLSGSIPHLDSLESAILSPQQAVELAAALGEFLTETGVKNPFQADELSVTPAGNTLAPLLSNYSVCKRQLIASGYDAALVEEMPAIQVVTLRWVQVYRDMLDEELAFCDRPLAEATKAYAAISERLNASSKSPEGFLMGLLLPAVDAAKSAFARQSQTTATLRVIEALRLYAAEHDGRLPSKLSDIETIPLPLDPISAAPYDYQLQGDQAVLAPKELQVGVRYEITVRK